MKALFRIQYYTVWGQNLYLLGSHPALGSWDVGKSLRMLYGDNGYWHLEVDIADGPFEYKYFLYDGRDGACAWEWGPNRMGLSNKDACEFLDEWRPLPPGEVTVLDTLLFDEERRAGKTAGKEPDRGIEINVYEPRIRGKSCLGLVGSNEALGNWTKARPMRTQDGKTWTLILSELASCEYKFVLCDRQGAIELWEEGANRYFTGPDSKRIEWTRVSHHTTYLPLHPWRGAGLAIPLFSLRTKNSLGCGEFADLKLLADWAASMGLQILQLLPVNDTSITGTWKDSYPYATLSVFALHPLYVSLPKLAFSEPLRELLKKEKAALSQLHGVDYERTLHIKMMALWEWFALGRDQIESTVDYQRFLRENEWWLMPYSVFCSLRDTYRTSDFSQWPSYHTWQEAQKLLSPQSDRRETIDFYCFVQYILHQQFQEASRYVQERGLALKGDLPVGVHRHSVDTWAYPELFKKDQTIGAPPDAFAKNGQNWRFPAYDWPRVLEHEWLTKRLQQMALYFQVYRVDHILGYFRIWEIPVSAVWGTLGKFFPAIPLYKSELEQEGLWDFQRMTEPYITTDGLQALFSSASDAVASAFLERTEQGLWRFQSQFPDQRTIIDRWPQGVSPEFLQGVLGMMADKVLLREDQTHAYHPRIAFQETASFQALDGLVQDKLSRLATDYFYRRQEDLWRQEGERKLPRLRSATRMLVCGEDLGMVPACVPPVMSQQRILALRIQRMPTLAGRLYEDPALYPYLCVASTSSHDTSTLRQWWRETPSLTQHYWNDFLMQDGTAPCDCPPWAAKEIIRRHLSSPCMLAIFPVQDLLAMDADLQLADPALERINEPSDPDHYWRYRLHLNLEDLIEAKQFAKAVREMVLMSGRETPPKHRPPDDAHSAMKKKANPSARLA